MPHGASPLRRVRRYDVPSEYGAVRFWPTPQEMPLAVWQNRERAQNAEPRLLGSPAWHWRHNARRELLNAALASSPNAQLVAATGHDAQPREDAAPDKPIMLTGHQPGFLHAGIAVKFATAHWLARHFDGFALNLVVDSDLPRDTDLLLPVPHAGQWRLDALNLVPLQPDLPMEYQPLPTEADLERFAARLETMPLDYLPQDAVPRLLHALRDAAAHTENLPALFADLTRQYGRELGWEWLDLPVSHAARSESFLAFAGEFLRRNEELWTLYNAALATYRQLNHVRSRTRPVSDLAGDPEGPGPREMPFWLFRHNQPRRPLFVRRHKATLHLGDGRNESCQMPAHILENGAQGAQALQQCLDDHAIELRPRAVTLTAWARLFLGDYFIHGIGGARYDAVTDALLQYFFQVRPPAFAVATATLYPAVPGVPEPAQASERLQFDAWLTRDLQYNPQRHLQADDPAALDLAHQRLAAVAEAQQLRTAHADPERRRKAFERIRELNSSLQPWTSPHSEDLTRDLTRDRQRLHDARVTHHRDCFFGLFPPSDLAHLCPNHH